MTFLDKLQQEHPEKVYVRPDGCIFGKGCPGDYGYEEGDGSCYQFDLCCEECWLREMPNTQTEPQKKSIDWVYEADSDSYALYLSQFSNGEEPAAYVADTDSGFMYSSRLLGEDCDALIANDLDSAKDEVLELIEAFCKTKIDEYTRLASNVKEDHKE